MSVDELVGRRSALIQQLRLSASRPETERLLQGFVDSLGADIDSGRLQVSLFDLASSLRSSEITRLLIPLAPHDSVFAKAPLPPQLRVPFDDLLLGPLTEVFNQLELKARCRPLGQRASPTIPASPAVTG